MPFVRIITGIAVLLDSRAGRWPGLGGLAQNILIPKAYFLKDGLE